MISGFTRLLIIYAGLVFFSSCVNTKKLDVVWVFKNQNIYEITKDSIGKTLLIRDSIVKSLTAKIIKRDSFLSLKIYDGVVLKDTLRTGNSAGLPQGLFFPYINRPDSGSSTFAKSKKLSWLTSNQVFQALSIPVKVRLRTGEYPYQAEGSINFGIAYGWKFTHHVYQNYYYRKTGDFVNSSENHYSLTPGLFAGPGIIELTPQNSITPNNRNILSFTYGAMLVCGVNRLNVGLALGFDNAVGNSDKEWVYQNKPWIGVTISFDLIQ